MNTGLDIDAAEAALAAVGAEIDFTQLRCGQLSMTSWLGESSIGALQFLSSNLPVDARGVYPGNLVALHVPIAGMTLTQNGIVAGTGQWTLHAAGAESLANNSASCRGGVFVFYVPLPILESTVERMGGRAWLPDASTSLLKPSEEAAQRVQLLAQSWCLDANPDAEDLALQILEILVDTITAPESDVTNKEPASLRTRFRVFDKACEYIDANLGHQLRISDICHQVGVTHRTLDRAFKEELQLGPRDWWKLRRLHRIRDDLLNERYRDCSIAEIAHTHGITHMGRLSNSFKAQFGFRPKDYRAIKANMSWRETDKRLNL